MRISKMIVALLVSVVAVTAMTGVAVAEPSSTITPSSATVNIITNEAEQLTVKYIISVGSNEKLPDGICVDIERTKPSTVYQTDELNASWDGSTYNQTVWCTTYVPNPVTEGSNLTWTWTSWIRDAKDDDDDTQMAHNYSAKYSIMNGTGNFIKGGTVNSDLVAGGDNTPIDPIPEFATIALPAIAVLGLFLYFRYKRKNE